MPSIKLNDPTGEETALAIICHLVSLVATSFLCNVFVPIIIMCLSDSPYVKDQAREALNFQISVVLWALIGFALCFVLVGIPLLIVLAIAAIVLPICACFAVLNGNAYRYPLTFRFVKARAASK